MTRKELEELLPDFAFGRMDYDSAENYKKHLTEHTDLQKEIAEVQKLFAKIEKMDFNSVLDSRTRNLGVKVNQRRSSKKVMSGNSFLIRYGIPAALVMVFLVTIFRNNFDKNDNQQISFSQKLSEALAFDDIEEESISDFNYLSNVLPLAEQNKSDFLGLDFIDDYNFVDFEEKKEIFFQITKTLPAQFLLNDVENMTEDDFLILLEEIQNVQI